MADRLSGLLAEAEAALSAAWCLAAERGLLPADAALSGRVLFTGDSRHGELSANHALCSARAAEREPRALAALLADLAAPGEDFSAVEAAGPGFVNFRLSEACYARLLRRLRSLPERGEERPLPPSAAPLYEAHYGLRRLRRLLARLAEEGITPPEEPDMAPLRAPEERALLCLLLQPAAPAEIGAQLRRVYTRRPVRTLAEPERGALLALYEAAVRVLSDLLRE